MLPPVDKRAYPQPIPSAFDSPSELLVFDDRAVFGVHVFTDIIRVRRGFTSGAKGYRLFAREHGTEQDAWSIEVPVRIRAMVLARARRLRPDTGNGGPVHRVPASGALKNLTGDAATRSPDLSLNAACGRN